MKAIASSIVFGNLGSGSPSSDNAGNTVHVPSIPRTFRPILWSVFPSFAESKPIPNRSSPSHDAVVPTADRRSGKRSSVFSLASGLRLLRGSRLARGLSPWHRGSLEAWATHGWERSTLSRLSLFALREECQIHEIGTEPTRWSSPRQVGAEARAIESFEKGTRPQSTDCLEKDDLAVGAEQVPIRFNATTVVARAPRAAGPFRPDRLICWVPEPTESPAGFSPSPPHRGYCSPRTEEVFTR